MTTKKEARPRRGGKDGLSERISARNDRNVAMRLCEISPDCQPRHATFFLLTGYCAINFVLNTTGLVLTKV